MRKPSPAILLYWNGYHPHYVVTRNAGAKAHILSLFVWWQSWSCHIRPAPRAGFGVGYLFPSFHILACRRNSAPEGGFIFVPLH